MLLKRVICMPPVKTDNNITELLFILPSMLPALFGETAIDSIQTLAQCTDYAKMGIEMVNS